VATPYERGEVDYWGDPIIQGSTSAPPPPPVEEEDDSDSSEGSHDSLGFSKEKKARPASPVTPPIPPRVPTPNSSLIPRVERMSSTRDTTAAAVYKTSIAKPEKYSGKKKDLKGFLRAVHINLMECHEINTNKKKVLFTLSFMTEGKAGDWAEDMLDVFLESEEKAGANPNEIWNFKEFKTQLQKKFEDVAEQKKARSDLDSMRQGKETVQDYLDKFDRLAHIANFDNDCMWISLAESCINTPLLEKLYRMETVPVT
jgi:hypothetical protein